MSRQKAARYTGYALGEILLIVVGILIALQLDNWNQERKASDQAEVWRTAIVEDLRATDRNFEWRIAYYKQALAFAETTLPVSTFRNVLIMCIP